MHVQLHCVQREPAGRNKGNGRETKKKMREGEGRGWKKKARKVIRKEGKKGGGRRTPVLVPLCRFTRRGN